MRKYYHQDSQKRIYCKNAIYFITINTFEQFPYFKEKLFCELFIEELKLCKKLKKFKLLAFCLNYDHLHLLIKPSEEFNYSKIIKSLKENFSRDVNYIIFNENFGGDTSTCRLQIRLIIDQYKRIFIKKYGHNQIKIPKFFWQKSFFDHIIRNHEDYKIKFNYIVYNYKKHGLPKDWKYTFLNYWDLIDQI